MTDATPDAQLAPVTKQAFVILAHGHWAQLLALVELLTALGAARIVVHIDTSAKVPTTLKPALLVAGAEVCAGVRVHWGHVSVLHATRNGLEVLLDNASQRTPWSHVTLLSGLDWPLQPLTAMERYLAAKPDLQFIEKRDMLADRWIKSSYYRRRYAYYWPSHPQRIVHKFVAVINKALGVNRSMPRDWHPWSGSQWWTITRDAAQCLCDTMRARDVDSFFSKTFIPDEMLPHTILANERSFSKQMTGHNLRLVLWSESGRPHILDNEKVDCWLDRTDQESLFFARKVVLERSLDFLKTVGAPLPRTL